MLDTEVYVEKNLLSQEEKNLLSYILQADKRYQDHEEFHDSNAESKFFPVDQGLDDSIALYDLLLKYELELINIRSDGQDDVMSKEDEKFIFLQMNYAKYRVHILRDLHSKEDLLSPSHSREAIIWYKLAKQRENTIYVLNMDLLWSIMNKQGWYKRCDADHFQSELQNGMLSSVIGFDASKGWKFSTYACTSLLRMGFKCIEKSVKRGSILDSDKNYEFTEEYSQSCTENNVIDEVIIKENISMMREILDENYAGLTKKEYDVMKERYFFEGRRPRTFIDIGKDLGVNKEIVRKMERVAMQKVKEYYDLLK